MTNTEIKFNILLFKFKSDNGREPTANIITELRSLWQELVIVHGRPRHPQSQGCVERANTEIKEMIISWMNDKDTTQWFQQRQYWNLYLPQIYRWR
jgi:transposase InsO family protein